MPVFLERLPFFDDPTSLSLAGTHVVIKPYQIVAWVSLGASKQVALDPRALRFPAVIDTGLSHNFAIREEQLVQWAGLYPQMLATLGNAKVNGLPVDLLDADVWVYRNRPSERDVLLDVPPPRLHLESGIAVYPRGAPGVPRLPMLGLRGLRRARLHLTVDCENRLVWLRTPRRFWPFG